MVSMSNIIIKNIMEATVSVGVEVEKDRLQLLAGDVQSFLLRKGFICEVKV